MDDFDIYKFVSFQFEHLILVVSFVQVIKHFLAADNYSNWIQFASSYEGNRSRHLALRKQGPVLMWIIKNRKGDNMQPYSQTLIGP